MSSSNSVLTQGDPIFHPRYGFGTIQGVKRQEGTRPVHAPANGEASGIEEYYDIHLAEGGTLLVPVDRAERVGLRRLINGVEAVKASLRSPAQSLPANFRERAALLRSREQLADPSALAHSVRDMLAQSRDRTLSAGEKAWLDKSCQRLSAEAALVDHISMYEARAAIWEVVTQLGIAA